jgi:hypothetical protein
MTELVERLVLDELWVLFRRVVPPTEMKRPEGFIGDRDLLVERGELKAKAFLLTQNLDQLETLGLDEFRVFQTTLDEI